MKEVGGTSDAEMGELMRERMANTGHKHCIVSGLSFQGWLTTFPFFTTMFSLLFPNAFLVERMERKKGEDRGMDDGARVDSALICWKLRVYVLLLYNYSIHSRALRSLFRSSIITQPPSFIFFNPTFSCFIRFHNPYFLSVTNSHRSKMLGRKTF